MFLSFSVALVLKRNTIQYSIIKSIKESIFTFSLEFAHPLFKHNKLVKQMSSNNSPKLIQMISMIFLIFFSFPILTTNTEFLYPLPIPQVFEEGFYFSLLVFKWKKCFSPWHCNTSWYPSSERNMDPCAWCFGSIHHVKDEPKCPEMACPVSWHLAGTGACTYAT